MDIHKTDAFDKVSSSDAPGVTAMTSEQEKSSIQCQQLELEVDVMCRYAMANGLDIPPTIIKQCCLLVDKSKQGCTELDVYELAVVHQNLNKIVRPATSQALMLIDSEKGKPTYLLLFGSVPIIRHVMVVSLFFLVIFILLGQLPVVNKENLHLGILSSSGWSAIAILSYLVSCAGLGACFTSLYRLNRYISHATYDPRYDSTYWSSILLGLISGLFISELLYMTFVGSLEVSSSTFSSMGKPALALVGGFSANMVYKILQRVVDSVESLFKDDRKALGSIHKDIDGFKRQQDEVHMALVNRLMRLQEQVESDPTAAKFKIRTVIDDLLSR